MLHFCCGFRPLIPSMIRAGLDGLLALQPYCEGMEPSGLTRDFGARILLNGAFDSQRVLIEGNPALVRRETRRTLDIMSPGEEMIVLHDPGSYSLPPIVADARLSPKEKDALRSLGGRVSRIAAEPVNLEGIGR